MLFPQTNRFRRAGDLSGIWDFRLDPQGTGERDSWFSRMPETGICAIAVPGSWNEQFTGDAFPGLDIHNYTGTAWYRKRFFPPLHARSGERIWLRFGAVHYRAKVWLNGTALGEHEGGFLPFCFDVTGVLRKSERNTLVLRVDNALSPETLPPLVPELSDNYPPTMFDFFPYGGIHRPVILYTTPPSSIEDVVYETVFERNRASIGCKITCRGKDADAVRISMRAAERSVAAEGRVREGKADVGIAIKDFRSWSPADPFLYECTVELLEKGRAVDEYHLPVGLRTIDVDGDSLLLNGKPIALRGVGKHEDFPVNGKGVNLPVVVRDFSLMKWLGCNALRTVHYPYCEEVLAIADRMGFLVMEEVPAVSLSYRHLTARTAALHRRMLRDMLYRDRNHPSVIAWCVANEPGTEEDETDPDVLSAAEKYFKGICDYTRRLDSSRPVTLASCRKYDDRILRHCDIVAKNKYTGWYSLPGRPGQACRQATRDLEALHRKLGKPVLVSEFGAGAIAGMHADPPQMFSEEYQADLLEEYIRMLENLPFVIGGFIWALADFAAPQKHTRVMGNRKGVFTRDRRPKMAAHRVRKLWNPEK